MLNRAALILRYKQPFVDWINAVDPSPTSHTLTSDDVDREQTVYLVEVEDEDELALWLARHHESSSKRSSKAGTRTRPYGRETGR